MGTLPVGQHVTVLDMAVDTQGRKWAHVTQIDDQDIGQEAIAVGWVEVELAGGVKLFKRLSPSDTGTGGGVAPRSERSLSYSAVEVLLGTQLRLGTRLWMLICTGPHHSPT